MLHNFALLSFMNQVTYICSLATKKKKKELTYICNGVSFDNRVIECYHEKQRAQQDPKTLKKCQSFGTNARALSKQSRGILLQLVAISKF